MGAPDLAPGELIPTHVWEGGGGADGGGGGDALCALNEYVRSNVCVCRDGPIPIYN